MKIGLILIEKSLTKIKNYQILEYRTLTKLEIIKYSNLIHDLSAHKVVAQCFECIPNKIEVKGSKFHLSLNFALSHLLAFQILILIQVNFVIVI